MAAPPRCANITSEGERRRRLGGLAALLAGGIVLAGLAWRGAPAVAYLALFPFMLGAGFGLFQASDRTCVALGFKDLAEVTGGGVRRLDDSERGQVRAQARRVLWKSFVFAGAVTGVAMLLAALVADMGILP